ncbi:MAG: hypothetical protein KME16_13830 [Scytolyngbya sp. HA4215-MV1]|nr:hypothetical protein [Scytolyngbya sp. HA4215-MV1]
MINKQLKLQRLQRLREIFQWQHTRIRSEESLLQAKSERFSLLAAESYQIVQYLTVGKFTDHERRVIGCRIEEIAIELELLNQEIEKLQIASEHTSKDVAAVRAEYGFLMEEFWHCEA